MGYGRFAKPVSRGSLAIDLLMGRWFDHKANKDGGVFDLIRRLAPRPGVREE
jgi:hypothetical protein